MALYLPRTVESFQHVFPQPCLRVQCIWQIGRKASVLFFVRRIVVDIAQGEKKKTDAVSSYSTAVFHSNNNEWTHDHLTVAQLGPRGFHTFQ